jgi:ribosome-associated protein
VSAARDKKAEGILVLDLRGRSDVTDFFVICHGTSERQTGAIADAIERRLLEAGYAQAAHVEGRRRGEWILLDYIGFVVHVFLDSRREFYRLERLWGDAPRVEVADVDEGAEPAAPRRRRVRANAREAGA